VSISTFSGQKYAIPSMTKLVLNVSLVVLAGAVLPVYSRAQTARERCGTGGTILSSRTISHNGNELDFITTSCPALSGRGNASAIVSDGPKKRQIVQCSDTPAGCTVQCVNLGGLPESENCQVIADALEAAFPAEFLAPSGTISTVTSGDCAFAFLNADTVDYEVCDSDFGFNGIITADDCFFVIDQPGATSGGVCVSPGVPGNDWIIEVFDPTA